MTKSTFQLIPVSALTPHPDNPRKRFDETAMKQLEASIRKNNVLVPLLVRAHNGGHQILAGERRFRAATATGLTEVPAIIRHMNDSEALELLLIENLEREDLHPLEEAEGYRTLIEKAGYDVPGIAARIGKFDKRSAPSVSYIYQRLKLLDLIPPARKAFLDDRLTAGHTILIARLQPKDQAEALKACFERHAFDNPDSKYAISVRALSRWIDENIHLDLHSTPWQKDDATLVPQAGACTTCPKRTGFEPALFPDIAKKDVCTDPTCFATKQSAFLQRRRTELKSKGEPFREISSEWSHQEKEKGGPLVRSSYEEAKKGSCANIQTGLLVDGREASQTKLICAEKNCKTHGRGFHEAYRPSPTELAKRKRQEEARSTDRAVRLRLLDMILDRAERRTPPEPSVEDLVLIAKHLIGEMQNDDRKLLAARRKWEIPRDRYGQRNYRSTIWKALAAFNRKQLVSFLIESTLVGGTKPSQWGVDERRGDLFATAKRFRINVKAIEREVRAAAAKTGRQSERQESRTAQEGNEKSEGWPSNQTSAHVYKKGGTLTLKHIHRSQITKEPPR